MAKTVFLDYASCTPVREEIFNTYMKLVKECYVNSEAVYKSGVAVHDLVEKSRAQIAKLLKVNSDEILFTSGASEANSLAVKGYALKNRHKGKHIITSKMEHSSVFNSVKQLEEDFGFEVTYLPVHSDGKISLDELKKSMRNDTILVSIMSVNNEIGSIQEIEEIAKIVKTYNRCKLHVDAVQSIGKIDIDIKDVDMMTIASHKLYGIKGCGVLMRRRNVELMPLVNGGQQEAGIRGGTLDAPVCIVFAKTLRLALEEKDKHYAYVRKLQNYLREELSKLEDIHINSPIDNCAYIMNFSCTRIGSEIMMNALNAKNICVSAQSTCSSRTKAPSHTLKAMDMSDAIAYGAIRVSLSHLTTMDELEYFIKTLKEIIHEYRT